MLLLYKVVPLLLLWMTCIDKNSFAHFSSLNAEWGVWILPGAPFPAWKEAQEATPLAHKFPGVWSALSLVQVHLLSNTGSLWFLLTQALLYLTGGGFILSCAPAVCGYRIHMLCFLALYLFTAIAGAVQGLQGQQGHFPPVSSLNLWNFSSTSFAFSLVFCSTSSEVWCQIKYE